MFYMIVAVLLLGWVGQMDEGTRAKKTKNLVDFFDKTRRAIHTATAPNQDTNNGEDNATNNADAEVASHEDPRTTDRRWPQDGVGQHQGEVSETLTRVGPTVPMAPSDYPPRPFDRNQPR